MFLFFLKKDFKEFQVVQSCQMGDPLIELAVFRKKQKQKIRGGVAEEQK